MNIKKRNKKNLFGNKIADKTIKNKSRLKLHERS
jgi:hypothetical protein